MQIVCTSPWVPLEWIVAHGFTVAGPWPLLGYQAGAVPEGVCAFAQNVTRLAPASPIILTTACDQMRRAADAIATRSTSRVFLFNLPATWQSAAARRLYHAELERLGKFLLSFGGRSPSSAELNTIIERIEQHRNELRVLLRSRSARQCAKALMDFFCGEVTEALEKRAGQSSSLVAQNSRVPLAIVGGPLLPSQWTLFDAVEEAGGTIVLNATEPGERCLLPPLPKSGNHEPPISRLANHYFDNMLDVFSRPNSRLYSWLAARLEERRVRGIVLWSQVGCDLWRAEAQSLREAFKLPVLSMDSQGFQTSSPREVTRLSAFVESLQ